MNKSQSTVNFSTGGPAITGPEVPAGKVVCPECGKLIFSCTIQAAETFLASCDQCAYGSRF